MSTATRDQNPESELSREDRELMKKANKLKKIARYTGNALNIMLTVLKEASAGTPILRPITGSALAILENVQLEKRLKPKSGAFSRFTQSKGYKNEINDLREKLKSRRADLHLLVSAFTYRGTVCRFPVGSTELQQRAEAMAQSKCEEWQQLQQQYLNGVSAGPGAVMNSQVGTVTAKKATKNAVGTMGTIYNGDGCTGNNTIYNFGPRGETKHNIKVGSIGNYNSGDVYATLNQGCNTMYFDRSQYSQEPMNETQWDQQQQWPPQGMNSPPTHAQYNSPPTRAQYY
ncbi:hypothetical protein EST38_g13186 [Candolleomyces aberdarensis]|uniref:Uncharacterized protein n=1 Tax=Candolleomyces aberdarensis TaxID=2316362 RepID=A0A4V1Q1T1_9AGAR|nr:hypothetical protein EST38_g13186 [Candolleomyces aberdarensis]